MDSSGEISLLCRLCLDKEQVNVPIFVENADIRQIFLKISSCLPVKVSKEDPLPKNICEGCSDKLDLLYTFWNTSRDAEKTLLLWLQQAQLDNAADKAACAISKKISAPFELVKKETEITGDVSIKEDNDGTGAPPAKRARRTAAVKAQISINEEESEEEDDVDAMEPLTKVEGESDISDNESELVKEETELTEDISIKEDSDGSGAPPFKGASASISQEESEEEDDVDDMSEGTDDEFVDLPGTSVDKEQAGPSGVGKEAADAPDNPELVYLCHQCPKYFTTSSRAFQGHLNNKHRHIPEKNETTSRYHCPQCDNAYLDRDNLIRHIRRVHEKEVDELQCDICGLHLSRKYIPNHKKKVHSKVSVSCELCDKTFVYLETLKTHMDRDHSQTITLFQCEVDGCEKVFKRSCTLKWHQNAHLENKETFQCDQCDKSYTNYNTYRRHMYKHNNPKSHACTVCDKVLTRTSSLKIHMRTHTGEKPFKCEHCDKSFISKASLSEHKVLHVKEKPYKCKMCGKEFMQRGSRLKHMKKIHPE